MSEFEKIISDILRLSQFVDGSRPELTITYTYIQVVGQPREALWSVTTQHGGVPEEGSSLGNVLQRVLENERLATQNRIETLEQRIEELKGFIEGGKELL